MPPPNYHANAIAAAQRQEMQKVEEYGRTPQQYAAPVEVSGDSRRSRMAPVEIG
jgi:hypothetical protein